MNFKRQGAGSNFQNKKTIKLLKLFVMLLLTILIQLSTTLKSQQTNRTSFLQQDFDPSETINIHVIPHSHDDAGWLRTFEHYYDGSKGMGCVKCVLDTMIKSLEENEKRTFTYVEMSFFEKWYKTLSEAEKLKIQFFVQQGRLEFLNGGWVMNDEATTHYQHIIDQMRLGMFFLKKEFNVVPKTAWFLDPFGHSASNAYLMRKLGFENMVIVRIDYRDKEKRRKNKELEFHWKPYSGIDNGKGSILTHITYGHYSPDYKVFANFFGRYALDSWMIKGLMGKIYLHFLEIAKAYRTNQIMFLYGDDFAYGDKSPFEDMEKLMRYFAEEDKYKGKVNLFYSTPSRYFEALNERISKNKITLPEYSDKDFFPYADKPREYWTGFYTSRPFLKGVVRDAGNFLDQTSQFLFRLVQRNSIVKVFNTKENLENKNSKEFNYNHNSAPNHSLADGSFKNFNNDLGKDKSNSHNNIISDKNLNDNSKNDPSHLIKGKGKNDKDETDYDRGSINPSDSNQKNFIDNRGRCILPEYIKKMDKMRRELAIAQHHDSVTGTARDDVSDDYILRLENGILGLSDIIKAILIQENPLTKHINPKDLLVCLDSVAYSACVDKVFKEDEIRKGILLTTLNPGYQGKYPRKIKVNFNLDSEFLKNSNKKISLKKFKPKLNNNNGNTNDQFNIHEELEFDLFYDEKSECYFIYYILEFLDDLEYYNILLQIEEAKSDKEKLQNRIIRRESISKYVYGTNINNYKVSSENGNMLEFYLGENKINFIQKITSQNFAKKDQSNSNSNLNNNQNNNSNNIEEEYTFSLSHVYYNYISSSPNRHGAYLMSTNSERPDTHLLSFERSSISIGRILTQITLRFDLSSLLIRIYNPTLFPDRSFTFELESILHKLEPKNTQKEFLLMINSNIDNLGVTSNDQLKPVFFTDSNAMRVMKRVANTRESFDLGAEEEKAASNFYPVNSLIFIQDSNKSKNDSSKEKCLFLFNDRSQGATSLAKGEILIDINRWSDKDDGKGLVDGLNEMQSSKRDFSVTHMLALSRNFDYESLKKFADKKPLTAIYLDYFRIEGYNTGYSHGEKNSSVNGNHKNLRNLGYGSDNIDGASHENKNKIEDLFEVGNKNCFEINYYFVSEKKILVQFYNKSDPYLFTYSNCIIKLIKTPLVNFSKYNLNGVEKKKNKLFAKEFLKKRFFISLDDLTEDSLFHELLVPQQDFETILLEF